MRILAYSDLIKSGHYRLHSTFSKVINYQNAFDELSLSFCLPSVELGPYRVIVSQFLEDMPSLIGLDISTYRNQKNFSSSFPKFSHENQLNLSDNLSLIDNHIKKISSEDSLAFLIANSGCGAVKREIKKSLENMLFKLSQSSLSKKNIAAELSSIQGLGVGLTPSGDDFIGGALIAFHYLEQLKQIDFKSTREEIMISFISENPFSRLTVSNCACGLLTESFISLAQCLGHIVEKKELLSIIDKIISHGATSGSDMLLGFVEILKRRDQW